MFNAALLRVAREAMGLTQRDLAIQAGFDQADVSRWERGIREPAAAHIDALGAIVGVAPRFLTRQIPVTAPIHRSARVESKRVQRQVNGRLELSRIAIGQILDDVDVEAPFRFPTIEEPGPPDPERAAESVRRVWRIPDGPIVDLARYLEAAGAIVLKVDFGIDAIIAAYTQLAGNSRWFFLNVRSTDNARTRFSLAHELGHAVLHWDRFDAPVGSEAEREAHRFAAALLMPRGDFMSELSGSRLSISDLVYVGERWGVSPQALIVRAADLDLISPHQKRRHFQRLNAKGVLRVGLASVPAEQPQLVSLALNMQRKENGYSEHELSTLAGLSLARLGDLLPDYFAHHDAFRARLRIVEPNERCPV
jgi:Zn-dependent peptidase ImmA (M78 family)/DNA-binding XRE family transcriptional regulator